MSATLFVAAEAGFWHNPRIRTFARAMRNPLAGAMVLQLREFFLLHGEHGVLDTIYTEAHIAEAVGFNGTPRVLVKQLERLGVLQRRRGRWIYPGWTTTVTGYWEQKKQKERERWEARRAGVSGGGSGSENPGSARGDSAESPRRILDQANNKGPAEAGAPPSGPPSGGVGSSAARLAWTEANYPLGLVDPPEVERLLGALTEGEWLHFRHAVATTYRKKNPAFVKPAEVCLKARLYRLVKLPKPAVPKAPPSEAPAAPAEPTPEAIELEKERDKQVDFFKQLNAIRERLKAKGLKGMELEEKAIEELDRLQAPPRLEVVR